MSAEDELKESTKKEETVALQQAPPANNSGSPYGFATVAVLVIIAVCSIIMVGELGSVISLASKNNNNEATTITVNTQGVTTTGGESTSTGEEVDNVPDDVVTFNRGANVCAGKKLDFPNAACFVDAMVNVGPQAGANVTKGYKGGLEVDHLPITTPYYQNGMCPVNVHWHLGTEHLSVGQYDEMGTGPGEQEVVDGGADPGYRCNLYDETDPKFTKPFDWKHCIGMNVGETYEVHWPHSAAGACGTPNQYQTPFYDGVFCNLDLESFSSLAPQDIAFAVGVQAQVFTIVNDEEYFWPDLMRGMIVEGTMGQDIAKYTGSTTGSSRNNDICSQYTPITWQVDRQCHLISASTFDKMCADMKTQRDDMTLDLFPHGSRILVDDRLVANNQHDRRRLRASA